MTSIVVLLYFKQGNCEILISPYNWGWMKHCQSQLVSYKVEWFCSLAGFSWVVWSLFYFSLFLCLCLFKCSFSFFAGLFSFFFAHSFSEEQRKRARRWGVALLQPFRLSVRTYTLTCCSSSRSRKAADFTTFYFFSTAEQYTFCIYSAFSYLHSAKKKKKGANISSFCFIKQSTNRNAGVLITPSVWSNEDMLWDCLCRIHRYGSKSLHIDYWRISFKLYLHKSRKRCRTENPNIYCLPRLHKNREIKVFVLALNEEKNRINLLQF